jgi:CPA2 family monovalent cation:H+ antiporter-2
LLSGASDESLERLAASAGELTSPAGQVVALEGDPGSGMFLILDGTALVEWRGGSVKLGPGAFFGELTLLAPGGTRIARVRASTEMRCLAIPRDDAIELIESEHSVALVMLKEIARRFASALPDD